ncbi:PH domain-containing protein [Cellulomonas shaoxiangyii]|uniref:YdbS-like PH domain-containing protein n=1 Tax=Cellulomonas shaoxiangyii TaxID=2566013 RepID=A0A4P7SK03_9CELL|nr:PH domain-containing protein [Cellulomonas shaoxiangyii]QCB94619.1 hypothetical protein E5225_14685 [Cellulomonas shaoxiangyii]
MSTDLRPVPEAAPEDAYDWRRMHPVTPALRGWKVFVAFLAYTGYQAVENLRGLGEWLGPGRAWLVVIGVLLLVAVVGFVYSALAWRVTRFAVTDEAVHLRTGLLFRQQRQARLDRLQAVDVVQPLLARLLGLAQLNLEVAGGTGSAVQLAFLREPEAESLRAQILALSAGLRPAAAAPAAPGAGAVAPAGTAGPGEHTVGGTVGGTIDVPAGGAAPVAGAPAAAGAPGGAPAPTFAAAPEQQVYEVPMPRLVRSILRSGAPYVFLVAVAGGVVGAVAARDVGPLFVVVPGALGIGGYVWGRLNVAATFRAATSPDGIRLRHGLTETRTQTVPPGRVQAVRLTQGPLWRRPDWWRIEMNVAGYGAEATNESVLHPVATRQEAAVAMWLVLPDLGTDDPLAALDAAYDGSGDDGGFTPAPRRARWLDPLGWRRHGVLVTRTALIMRSGRWWRTVVVVPHERTQSLAVTQGPVQRRLGVATFVAHSTPGPVSPQVAHLDGAVAGALLGEQAERARQARAVAGPELWMRAAEAPHAPASLGVGARVGAGDGPALPGDGPALPGDGPAGPGDPR